MWTSITIIIFGLVALYAFWLLQKYWELRNIPVNWFGYLWAAHCTVRGITAFFAHYIESHTGPLDRYYLRQLF